MGEQRSLNILKGKIKLAYLEEDNFKCLELADELIAKKPTNEFLWYGWYSKSLIYMRLDNMMDNALLCAKNSIKYVEEVDVFNISYSLSMWALARIYSDVDKIKAVEIYKILSKIYRELTNDRMRLSCIFNMAIINLNFTAMQRLINIVENTNTNDWYFEIDKQKFIANMKLELDTVKGI